jgi:hypothetical protein
MTRRKRKWNAAVKIVLARIVYAEQIAQNVPDARKTPNARLV